MAHRVFAQEETLFEIGPDNRPDMPMYTAESLLTPEEAERHRTADRYAETENYETARKMAGIIDEIILDPESVEDPEPVETYAQERQRIWEERNKKNNALAVLRGGSRTSSGR